MNILEQFRSLNIEDQDIELIVGIASGGASVPGIRCIDFYSNSSNSELYARFKFNKFGNLHEIVAGPALASPKAVQELIQRAKNETVDSQGTKVLQRNLFSQLPLKGAYTWQDKFCIRPYSSATKFGDGLNWYDYGVPGQEDTHLGPPFPFLLEVKVPRSSNPLLEAARGLRSLDQYQWLLTLLLNGNLTKVFHSGKPEWTWVKLDGKNEPHLLHQGFGSNAETEAGSDFSPHSWPNLKIDEKADYYDRLWGTDGELQVPSSLSRHLELFNGLDRKAAANFVRACYWYALGLQFDEVSTVSTVSFSAAIECLLPQPSEVKCEKCSKSTGHGPNKLFKDHILRYGNLSPELEKLSARLYDIRSDLVHGRKASRVDVGYFSGKPNDKSYKMLLSFVTRRCLIGWLEDESRSASSSLG